MTTFFVRTHEREPLSVGLGNSEPGTRDIWKAIMKAALLKRLQRLEEVRAAEPRSLELQFGYLKKPPPDYTGERHIVTLVRSPDGEYQWEERPSPTQRMKTRTASDITTYRGSASHRARSYYLFALASKRYPRACCCGAQQDHRQRHRPVR
jgi:hypothetical protein